MLHHECSGWSRGRAQAYPSWVLRRCHPRRSGPTQWATEFFQIVGLPDTAVNEARERLRSGLSCHRAHVAKSPTHSQPFACRRPQVRYKLRSFHRGDPRLNGLCGGARRRGAGRAQLDRSIRPVSGITPALLAAQNSGTRMAIVPRGNREEAMLVEGIEVIGAHHLAQVALLCGVPGLIVPGPQRHGRTLRTAAVSAGSFRGMRPGGGCARP